MELEKNILSGKKSAETNHRLAEVASDQQVPNIDTYEELEKIRRIMKPQIFPKEPVLFPTFFSKIAKQFVAQPDGWMYTVGTLKVVSRLTHEVFLSRCWEG